MDLSKTPAMKRERVPHHWPIVKYTAADGQITKTRTLNNAVISLYGATVMIGQISYEHVYAAGKTGTVQVYSLREFRKDGTWVKIGSVSWIAER